MYTVGVDGKVLVPPNGELASPTMSTMTASAARRSGSVGSAHRTNATIASIASSLFHTPEARRVLSDLRRSDPHLAAEAIKGSQAYEELETEPDRLIQIRKFALFMSLAAYAVPALVLLGGIAVAGGVPWLRSL